MQCVSASARIRKPMIFIENLKWKIIFFLLLALTISVSFSEGRSRIANCKCSSNKFACSQGSHGKCACIPMKWKCDGDFDCGDFSDERDCQQLPCPTDWFHCGNGQCIKNDWKCDGDNDCMDDTDEQNCEKVPCTEGERACSSGACIPISWWCDNDKDCADASDELKCEKRNCTSDEFHCHDGGCVLKQHRCDHDFDCSDGSDEGECDIYEPGPVTIDIPYNLTCKDDEFACVERKREGGLLVERCINSDYVCDGDYDCDSGLDEEECERPCTSEEHTCANRKCISLHNHCDGTDDCGDGSDEISCEQEECTDGELRCDNGICISRNWRCDGDSDCKDGSDELDCDYADTCGRDQFECQSDKRCILSSWRCDGVADCDDGTDELYCGCDIGQYQCKSGECIAFGKLCNGIPNCEDGSDERPVISCNKSIALGTNVSSCSGGSGGCEHACKVMKDGQKMCVCQEGYRLASDLRSCNDIDECATEGSCSQICNNTIGSFLCSCLAGYGLRPDGRTCRASGPPPALLFTNRIDIRRMFPDRSELQPILRNLENAIGLDYHIEHELMFWSDVTLDKIMRSNINGSDVQEVVSSGLESPGDVAVDWVHDLLYWTDSRTSRIEVALLNGTFRKVLIWEDLQRPRSLALHPLKGLMFWTDWGRVPYLGCAAMDGSMRKHLATSDVYWPNGLTIDYTTDHIYWIDAKYHIIETANLDGGNRRPVISSGLRHPFGITLFEDEIYWTDWQTKSVNTANKFTGGGVRTIRKRLFFPMNIRTYHPLRQPQGENKCLNANCSHLCLPTPLNFTCACPTGFRTVDTTRCAEDIEAFLVFTSKTDIRRISFDASERTDSVVLEGLTNAVALDWHSGPPGYIYWSDIGLDTISRCNWDGSNQKVLISSSLDSPAGIAIDWITNKIYWTDSGLNRIEVAMLDGSMRCVLVWTGLDRPRAIIVHPKTGHMFWTDWGQPAKIERAGMDGSQRVTIVSTDVQLPNGIAIDNVTERIYWADAGTKMIESCDINGGKRRKIVTNLLHPFGITLDDTRVFWTDWSTKNVSYANKLDGSNSGYMRKGLSYLMDIRYYHKSRYQTPNPCSLLNGGCSHLCLLAPIPNDKIHLDVYNTPYTCACPTGLVLGLDKRTCNTNMIKFLVIARRVDIYAISLDVSYSADIKLHINSYMSNVVDVAVDPMQGHLYWSDIGSNKISRTNLSDNPGNETVIIDTGLHTVDGLALDVNGRLIYWTDDGKNTISVASLDGKNRRVLISEHLDSPRAIALHYEIGYMYWTDWGNTPTAKIERAGLDGSNRTVVVSSNLTWPNGLTIDHKGGLLIWGDAQNEKIEVSDLLGRHRTTLFSPVRHPYSLTTLDGYLYWTDWQTRNIEQLNLHNTSQNRTMRENMPSMMGIKAVSMNGTFENKCGTNNGGCSHLCLRSPVAELGYTCSCPTGIQLQNDGQTCSDLPSEYLLFTSRNSIQRLSLEADQSIPVVLPIKNLENAIALDYHYQEKLLFYTDVDLDVIKRSNLDGSDVRVIVSNNLKTMDGIAVDWIANNFYWTDAGLNTISVARLDGGNRKIIVDHGLDEPRALCVHPSRGAIFWTDWGGKPRIEKSFMDGSTRKILVQKNVHWPNGLTIDYFGSRLFWVDAHQFLNRIESCDLNGKKRTVVISSVLHGFSITYFADSADYSLDLIVQSMTDQCLRLYKLETKFVPFVLDNTLYWTDWQTKNIHSASLLSDKIKQKTLLKGIEELMGIKAVSALRQSGTSLCDSTKGYGGCSHLCLMKGPRKFVCATPDVSEVEFNYTESIKNLPTISPTTYGKIANVTMETSAMMTSLKPEKPVAAEKSTPSTGHLVGAFIAAAMAVFGLCVGFAFLAYRRLVSKRRDLETPNVGFRNRTYEGNSNSTLTERRTPLTTPSPSLRISSEEGEEKAFLLTPPTEPGLENLNHNPLSKKSDEIAITSSISQNTSESIPISNETPLSSEERDALNELDSALEITDAPDPSCHVYATIGDDSVCENETNALLQNSPLVQIKEPKTSVATASTSISETDLVDLDDLCTEETSETLPADDDKESC